MMVKWLTANIANSACAVSCFAIFKSILAIYILSYAFIDFSTKVTIIAYTLL